jgi:branched-chain amino acid transport system ATP-binding protein
MNRFALARRAAPALRAAGGTAPVLALSHVTAGYGEKTVVRDVSLSVTAGASLAVLGPNGAGKTTLLKACSGLLKPSSGGVLLDGADVTRLEPNARAKRGLCHIPDPRGIFPGLTVKENLVLQAHGSVDEALEKATHAFPRLGQRITQLAGTMSGGEQQMLAVARAYVQHPRVVLLDEVSMGLAPKLVDEIFDFLGQLKQEGVALVVVEQFVHRALALVDDVVVLARGRVQLTGPSHSFDEETLFAAYAGQLPADLTTSKESRRAAV